MKSPIKLRSITIISILLNSSTPFTPSLKNNPPSLIKQLRSPPDSPPIRLPSIPSFIPSSNRPTSLLSKLDDNEIRSDPTDALSNVGWGNLGTPSSTSTSLNDDDDDGLTSDSPFVRDIDEELSNVGGLDQLLNPATVVNVERQIVEVRLNLAIAVNRDVQEYGDDWAVLRKMDDEEFDDPSVSNEDATKLRSKLSKLRQKLNGEKRSVFRGWLKDLFLAQAILSFILSFVMSTNPALLFGSFAWFNDPKLNMSVSISVLGFWWWWLFIVPSLRSRRPTGREKEALDLAFVLTPATSLIAPALTKDTGVIWGLDAAVFAACYAYAYLKPEGWGGGGGGGGDNWIWKALDFGGGRERGANSAK
ncbi:hypothetical protein TrCOL_g10947 [Triparma columacea]|uniref:Uncharacterized protein n=1 Tax=Triparma columacea TaxID=722753 RepID=A0A9W7GJC9_9STRA|nr:hypothetical protein TrCOL_g10947 [Triparma columacea]